MSRTFPDGSVVRLKSGGPQMTVVDFGDYSSKTDQYLCKWFDAKHNLVEGTFGEAELELYQPPTASFNVLR